MATKLREVKIEEYWPLIVKNTAEFGQIAVAENPEFNKLAECVYRVLCDSFIDADMTEYGVSRWEKMLGITPAEGSSLDDRKAAILTQLSVKIPYTWRVLKQMLVPILGGEDKFVMEYVNDEGKLVLHTDRISDDKLETVNTLLEKVIPQNIQVVQYNHCIVLGWRELNAIENIMAGGDFLYEYLKEENKFILHTDRATDEQIEQLGEMLTGTLPENVQLVQYNHNMEISWRDINKYAECKTADAVKAVNEDYKNDLTSDKWWVYNLTSLKRALRLFEGSPIEFFEGDLSSMNDGDGMFISTKIKKFNTPMPSLTTCSGMFLACRYLESFDCNLDKLKMGGTMFFGAKLTSFKNALPVMTNGYQMFRNNPLEVFESELPSLSNGGIMFVNCKLNKASALRVLNSIPAHASGEHLLDIGIHVDHKQDEEVLAAIANAEAKGWTLTVQWNGTATSGVSTLDLEEIYAKVTESEYGEYTDENGTRCTLDWGHYVTDPSEYKLFFSLVEAEQYFKLTRIENNE